MRCRFHAARAHSATDSHHIRHGRIFATLSDKPPCKPCKVHYLCIYIYVIYLLKIQKKESNNTSYAKCRLHSFKPCFHCLPHIVPEMTAPSCPSTEEPRVGGGHWYLASRRPGSGCKPWSGSLSKAKVVLEIGLCWCLSLIFGDSNTSLPQKF